MGFLSLILFELTWCASCIAISASFNKELYYDDVRSNIIAAENLLRTGGNIYLNRREQAAEEILLNMKKKSIEMGISNPSLYAPSMHFFQAKSLIDKDPIFDVIKKFPKGAVLHVHNTASVSSKWVISNLTYRFDIKLCTTRDGIKIFETVESKLCVDDPVLIRELRATNGSTQAFDNSLEQLINLFTEQPSIDLPDVNSAWEKFQNMFKTVNGIFSFAPTYLAYHRQLLEELYDDNIMYAEIRSGLSEIENENGKMLSSEQVVQLLLDLVKDFKKDHPKFLGVKWILTLSRNSDLLPGDAKMQRFVALRQKYPDSIIGFDLVGQEDLGKPLSSYVSKLKDISQNGRFFFHAGETNWFNTNGDLNLIDAILMNTKRLGHGYSLYKHPVLWAAFKEKDIAIEINPLSNQILHLVQDLRNHPAAFYISENVPIVISNDDPGFWGAKGLSYDFYFAFMAFTPADAGLQILKQLSWNSIKYSALSKQEKSEAANIFKDSWEKFIEYLLTLKKN